MSETATLTLEEDPVYDERYEDIRDLLRSEAEIGLIDTFHVGSTAIPDLDGKPELDVIAVYENYEAMDAAATAVEDAGFERMHDDADCIVSVRQTGDLADIIKFHLPGDERVHNQLLGREYLREHESARREYERIKQDALDANTDDRHGYTSAKTEFVATITERAIEEGYDERLPETI